MFPLRPRPKDRRSGFALLITITLLAFLVILLVSLASLTRVETQVASNNQQLSMARQNALMALNIALGRLQTVAGPDQRVTATADIVATRDNAKKYWTGVWDTTSASSDKNIAWLVSGTAPAGSGGVTGALTAASGNSLVELVGANSTDTSVPASANGVSVETQPITADSIPGLSGPKTIGNYAWWVGDEGVKARVSLGDPWKNASSLTLTASAVSAADADTFSFFAAQREGIEGVSSVEDTTDTAHKLGAAYPASTDAAFRSTLPKILSLPQLPLCNAAGQTALAAAIRERFHDLTATSRSVLADVAAGGLKKDLTTWLRTPGANPAGSDYIPQSSALSGFSSAERYGLPKWGVIRSYANIVADGTAKAPITQTDEQQGLFPVMTFGRLGLAVSCEGAGQPLQLHLFPHLVLWNPANVPITGSFEFCFGYDYGSQAAFRLGSSAQSVPAKLRVYLGAASLTGPTGTPGLPYEYFRFIVNLPAAGIAPGQSLAFTLNSTGPYVAGTNVMEANNPVRDDNSVTIDGDTMSSAELAETVYCNINGGGGIDMLLCPVPAPGAPTPTSAQWVASAYQAARIGDSFGTPGSAIPSGLAQPSATVLAPIVDYRLSMNFSRNRTFTPTPRWLATLNPRAGLVIRKRSYFCFTIAYPGDTTPAVSGNENSAADGVDPSVLNNTVVRPVLSEFQPAGVPLFSIAQLQHAGLSLISPNPAYAVGNSYADFSVDRDQTSVASASPDSGSDQVLRIYDLSYLLNQALWDRYFFSTVPASLTSTGQLTADYHLPNSRNAFYWHANPTTTELAELQTTDGAAAHLLIDGGFNVNSTSLQAWRALLYSHNGPPPAGASASETHPYSRFSRPVGTTPNSTWEGYRVLTDAQLDNLAANIVTQVKARGPFLSLADFVNRRLVDNPATTADERLKGALQAAIDDVDYGSTSSYANNVNNRTPFTSSDTAYRITTYEGATADQHERYQGGADANAPCASLAACAPGFLTQADLLNALGPVLTARSDTFLIRAYGDTINPATGVTEGRAWCEAVVQRLPDYVDDSMTAQTDLASATASAAKTTNQTYGRRFKIVSFRWLNSGDI